MKVSQGWKDLSEVLLEEVQQTNLIMLPGLWTPDAVPFVGINLEKQGKIDAFVCLILFNRNVLQRHHLKKKIHFIKKNWKCIILLGQQTFNLFIT